MVTITAAQVSTRTTAAFSVCEWTSERLTRELPVRTAARLHIGVTGHSVLLLTNTVTVLEPLDPPGAVVDPAWPRTRPPRIGQPLGPGDPIEEICVPHRDLIGAPIVKTLTAQSPDAWAIDREGGTR